MLFDLVEECGHLVGENFLGSIGLLALHNFFIVIENVNILQEFATKSAEDQDLIFVQLVGALALTDREILLSVDLLPGMRLVTRVVLIEALDRVEVALVGDVDTGEHVNPSLAKHAGAVVVAALIQRRLLKPHVHIDVEKLNCPGKFDFFGLISWACNISFDARSSHHQELVIDGTD